MNALKFDRLKPYNNLPLLPPDKDIENNPQLLKRISSSIEGISIGKWKFK